MTTLLDATKFRNVVSGQRRGLVGTAWRALFSVAELPYRCAVAWRNRQFDTGRRTTHQVGVPVISVGNLTVGGTGKTPMVEWLAKWYRGHGIRVVVISRGYGAQVGSRNDEALELEQKLPDVPHLQNPDRVEAAKTAIEEFDSQLILLDDAFQHRRIHRDLNLVLIDALEPFGYGHLLPRGLLREPIVGLRRADAVVLTRADAVNHEIREQIHSQVSAWTGDAAWIEVSHQPVALRNHTGQEEALDPLPANRIAAFCGIGNPAGFRHSLTACGFDIVGFREFPDHHAFDRDDLDSLDTWVRELDVDAAICTHKDLVKIGTDSIGTGSAGRCPLWALQIGLEILDGGRQLEARLSGLLEAIQQT
ncbi:MAG: tetraacyldisaccharide 4'-kinase [Pirellulaceae bacterium]|jgi:tetraacyldisaccharide 4'-kinase|nr:tetraacyldisaccharide 4'-kinase [Pirellulaceae bacterium]MDP6553261.1 tetraacyldisaccharide 4'-kinase [Pirellulaceae bacterium]MDP6723233.1 tetraacyldisaccharide 4'-kinase [Pirellulaceae bacterium]